MEKRVVLAAALLLPAALAWAQHPTARQDESGRALVEETEPHRVVTGRIAAVDPGRNVVVIAQASGGRTSLRLSPWTVITRDGGPASIGRIRQGVPVRATYDVRGGEKLALVLDVSQAGSFPPPRR